MGRVVIPGFRKIETSGGEEGGTSNYNDLTNKPSINNVPLVGNLNTANLKLTDATLTEEGVPAEAKTVGTKLEEQSTSLTALSEQLGNHTVKSDVPENAVFTDTVYDDTEVKESIEDLNSNLDGLKYSEIAGGKNLKNVNSIIVVKNDPVYITDYLLPIATYTISFVSNTSGVIDFYSIESHDDITGGTSCVMIANQRVSKSFTVNSPTRLRSYSNVTATLTEIQIEEGTTATPYEPYIPSIKMLALENARQNDSLSSLGKCKNLLKPTLQTTTQDGVTCTANGDGTYTLNGTAVSTTYFTVQKMLDFAKKTTNKDYKLVGCPTGGINKYDLRYEINNHIDNGGGKDMGEGVIIKNDKITSTDINAAAILIAITKGATLNNLVFKPMLTTNLDATYDDFVPYTGDGDTLTSDVAKINSDLSGLSFSVSDGTLSITDGTNTWTLPQTT